TQSGATTELAKGTTLNVDSLTQQADSTLNIDLSKANGESAIIDNPAKLRAYALSEQLKEIMAPLFQKHMDDIISGEFSSGMMADW
ncbi:hypothetical protein MJN51_33530, partial [Salmonella enterica subsp. enterica serovar Kentucky]|nr:hypothetical protein [Salmonella enterica subsp. enterica serovar Kentucky]